MGILNLGSPHSRMGVINTAMPQRLKAARAQSLGKYLSSTSDSRHFRPGCMVFATPNRRAGTPQWDNLTASVTIESNFFALRATSVWSTLKNYFSNTNFQVTRTFAFGAPVGRFVLFTGHLVLVANIACARLRMSGAFRHCERERTPRITHGIMGSCSGE